MGIMVSEVYEALIDAGASEAKAKAAAEAIPVSEQLAIKQDITDLKAELATAVNRMLLAQLAVAVLLFAALQAFLAVASNTARPFAQRPGENCGLALQ